MSLLKVVANVAPDTAGIVSDVIIPNFVLELGKEYFFSIDGGEYISTTAYNTVEGVSIKGTTTSGTFDGTGWFIVGGNVLVRGVDYSDKGFKIAIEVELPVYDDNSKYIDLITSEHHSKPKYKSYVKKFLDMLSPVVSCYNEYDVLFVLDTAKGDQLDNIGDLVGIGRNLPTDNQNIPSTLNDEYYRRVIRSRIYFNHWDGTRESLEKIIDNNFPGLSYELVDDQDMSYEITIIDPDSDPVVVALLEEGYILPKPSGVRVNYNVISTPYFGWDEDTNFIKGWEQGTWRGE